MQKIQRTYKGQALHESTLHELIDFTKGINQSEATIENNILSITTGDLIGSTTEFIEQDGEVSEMKIMVKEKSYATRFTSVDLTNTIYKNALVSACDTTSPYIVRKNGVDIERSEFTLTSDGVITFQNELKEDDEVTVHALTYDIIHRVSILRDGENNIMGWEII